MSKNIFDEYVKENREEALEMAGFLLGEKVTWRSLNKMIGEENKTYHISPQDYTTCEEYLAAWHKEHDAKYAEFEKAHREVPIVRMHQMLEDPQMYEYIDGILMQAYHKEHPDYHGDKE